MFSEKGKRLQVIRGFKFKYHKTLSGDVKRWVCVDKLCTAFLKIYRGGLVVEERTTHNHIRDSAVNLTRQRVSNAVKRKTKEDIRERPSKLLKMEHIIK